MTPTLLTLALSTGGLTILLSLIMVARAAKADEVVEAAPRFASIDHLDQQIQDKRDTLASIDNDIETRRKAMAQIADREAEYDELVRRRDDILDQVNRLAERREEIRAMDAETEEALVRFADAKRELSEAEDNLAIVEEKLDRADRLGDRIAELEEQKQELDQQVNALRAETRDLVQMQQDAAALEERLFNLRRETEAWEHKAQATQEQLHRAEVDTEAAEKARAEAELRLQEEMSNLASTQSAQRSVEAHAAELQARVAALQVEKGELDGSGPAEEDPLKDLRKLPPVLENLQALPLHHFGGAGVHGEQDALQNVRKTLTAYGLEYPERTLRAFHTAMKVNDTTQMAVLAGISGTGKSQLPRRYAEGMGIGFLQVPVQPRWDSPQDLMGFYNYIEKRYRPTEMAKALYHLDEHNAEAANGELQDRMMMILLDEMNLARVEYYFSDFLSRLESRRPFGAEMSEADRKNASLELELRMPEGRNPPVIYPGYNLLFAGTMNEDESTQSLSDKVVDRANVIRFAAPHALKKNRKTDVVPNARALSRAQWDTWRQAELPLHSATEVETQIGELADIMRELKQPIGHRMGVAISAYVANYPAYDTPDSHHAALADQIEMRLLPKLRGLDVDTNQPALSKLIAKAEAFHDHDLADAISRSIDQSQDTGQFVWRGVTR